MLRYFEIKKVQIQNKIYTQKPEIFLYLIRILMSFFLFTDVGHVTCFTSVNHNKFFSKKNHNKLNETELMTATPFHFASAAI